MLANLKGYRTVIFGLLVAIAPVALTYLAHVDWTKLIGANAAMIVVGAITVALRFITDTAVGNKV